MDAKPKSTKPFGRSPTRYIPSSQLGTHPTPHKTYTYINTPFASFFFPLSLALISFPFFFATFLEPNPTLPTHTIRARGKINRPYSHSHSKAANTPTPARRTTQQISKATHVRSTFNTISIQAAMLIRPPLRVSCHTHTPLSAHSLEPNLVACASHNKTQRLVPLVFHFPLFPSSIIPYLPIQLDPRTHLHPSSEN